MDIIEEASLESELPSDITRHVDDSPNAGTSGDVSSSNNMCDAVAQEMAQPGPPPPPPETPRSESDRPQRRGDLKVDIDAAKRAVSNALAGIELLSKGQDTTARLSLTGTTTAPPSARRFVRSSSHNSRAQEERPSTSSHWSTAGPSSPRSNASSSKPSRHSYAGHSSHSMQRRFSSDNTASATPLTPPGRGFAFPFPASSYFQDPSQASSLAALPPAMLQKLNYIQGQLQLQDYLMPYVPGPQTPARHPATYTNRAQYPSQYPSAAHLLTNDALQSQLLQNASQQLQPSAINPTPYVPQLSAMQSVQQPSQIHQSGARQQAAANLLADLVRPSAPPDSTPTNNTGLLALYESVSISFVLQAKQGNRELESQLQGEHTLLLAILNILLRAAQGSLQDYDAVADFNFVAVSARRHLADRSNITASFKIALQAVAHVIYLLCPAEKTELHQAAFRLLEVLAWNNPDLHQLITELQSKPDSGTPRGTPAAMTDLAKQILVQLTQTATRNKSLLDGTISIDDLMIGSDPSNRWLYRSLSAPSQTQINAQRLSSQMSAMWRTSANSSTSAFWEQPEELAAAAAAASSGHGPLASLFQLASAPAAINMELEEEQQRLLRPTTSNEYDRLSPTVSAAVGSHATPTFSNSAKQEQLVSNAQAIINNNPLVLTLLNAASANSAAFTGNLGLGMDNQSRLANLGLGQGLSCNRASSAQLDSNSSSLGPTASGLQAPFSFGPLFMRTNYPSS